MSELRLGAGTDALTQADLPQDWHAHQLSDFCSFSQGGRLGLTKQEHYRSSGIPAYSAAGQDGFVDFAEFRDIDAVVLSAIGANCGRCFLAQGDWTTLANVQVIIPDAALADARFVHYRVNRDDYWPRSGSAQPFIKPSDMKACWIALPPVEQQKKIAQILDTLDTAIRETEALIDKLKAVKQGLLHDLLTRGIDANGQLRPPQSEAQQLYKESPLGWMPREWKVRPLGHILAEPTKNGLYKSSQFHGRGPLMVQMGGLFTGETASFDTATHVQVTPSELNTFGLSEGDLLFARRSLVFEGAGQCVIVRHLSEPATFESSIVRVRVRQDEAHPEFVCQFLRGHRSNAQRRTLIRQVAVSGVSGADIRELLIALPSLDEQNWIVGRQLEAQTRIDLEMASAAKLRSQKAGLMDDLLTGRVRATPLLESVQQPAAQTEA